MKPELICHIYTIQNPIKCPKCKGKDIVPCKGGTCIKPDFKINWICKECLYEW